MCTKLLKWSKLWVLLGVSAGLCMGSGQFIFASNFSKYGFKSNGLFGPGTLILCIIAKLTLEIPYYLKNRRWFKEADSAWRTPEGKIKWTGVVALLTNSLANLGYTIALNLAWKFARMGGLN